MKSTPLAPRALGTQGQIKAMRLAAAFIGLALAGCAMTEPTGDVAMTAPGPQTAAPAAAAPPPATPSATPSATPPTAAPAPPPAPAPRVPRATRGNAAPPPAPEPAAAPEEPMTRERASQICWGKYDDRRKKLSLDQRADLVDKCVRATMRGEKVN